MRHQITHNNKFCLNKYLLLENQVCEKVINWCCNKLRGCSYGGGLAQLGGLAHLGEMIFTPRSYGIFYLSSIKNFVISLEKDCLIK